MRHVFLFYVIMAKIFLNHATYSPEGVYMNESNTLASLRGRLEEAFNAAHDAPALEALRVGMLGKKGEITQLLKSLGALAAEERREMGRQVNELRALFEEKFEKAKAAVSEAAQSAALLTEKIDPTLPGRRRALGHMHPMTTVYNKMIDFFLGYGFTIAEGPQIELTYYSFDALNLAPDHPTRDEQDTFYFTKDISLRPHTSPVQVRHMEKHQPPIRIISPGKVFRRDDIDATHTPVFHQMEGLVVDKGINLGDLKGMLGLLFRHLYGEDTKIRLRPSFFPFTEPSGEVDVTCHACHGNVPPEGCPVCKDSGWVEMGGCGVVHPNVLRMSAIDPEVYSGYAFGMGVDRITSSLYGITDPRHYFDNSMQFLSQF
jgi:phenylalanyl-tRNA synthetase alpha chain